MITFEVVLQMVAYWGRGHFYEKSIISLNPLIVVSCGDYGREMRKMELEGCPCCGTCSDVKLENNDA